jgi:hypothetical protein
MVNNLHLIIYRPGHAGTFLRYLFSLDESTVSHAKDSDNRLEAYSFNHALKYSHWKLFHKGHSDENIADIKNLPEGYDHLVYPVHSMDYHKLDLTNFKSVTYYQVVLPYEEFCDFWLLRTRELWGNWPRQRYTEVLAEEIVKKQLTLKNVISLNKLLDKSTWLDEYLRITNLMNIPPNIEQATILYNEWYNLRVQPLVDEFNTVDSDKLKMYSTVRKHVESIIPGTQKTWNEYYNSVKGIDWPECHNETDFYALPENIKHELIERFGYNPK